MPISNIGANKKKCPYQLPFLQPVRPRKSSNKDISFYYLNGFQTVFKLAFSVFCLMNGKLREGESDAFLVECFINHPVHVKVDIPIV